MQELIATEAGHYYERDGTPFYCVPRKSGPNKGQPRPVSLQWDRAIMMEKGVVPSVTTVLGCWEKFAINNWRARNIHEATVALIRAAPHLLVLARTNPDAFWKQCQSEAEKPRIAAADRGTLLHGDIEKFLLDIPHRHQEHIDNIVAALEPFGIDLSEGDSEKSFADKRGFGGKVDWHSRVVEDVPERGDMVERHGIVIDFKSKERLDKKDYGGPEHYRQLGAYREGLGIPNARGLSVFVGVEDCKVIVLEWTQSDLRQGFEFFKHVLAAWKIDKKYCPKL